MALAEQDTRDGVIVGLIAYGTGAVVYSLFDLLASRGPLYSVNLLGLAVFRDVRDSGVLNFPVQLDLWAIFLYNGLHLSLSLLIGVAVMVLVGYAERTPQQALVMLLLIVSGFVVTIAGVGWLSIPIRPLLPWWSIIMANAVAVVTAAVYVTRRRPGILGRLVPFGGG